ncbi:7-cyano-7-deazaguanine synthase QueC [Abyssicoccus albus]|uniref:7-cyano-7-deazaguanine synthase n=1 Tax=Abyssicoccus albus TaxID=1817405 RepID=A0A1Q1G311_9BACL|nr:7-cyano-7-deazaguanine synthase QueC [Abyssicoccus albus]AQL56727.1 7-cyano-7-deazaguanine synthase QueC [Abyssicoccus albus]RPF57450.1 preQ(0) biosynthesis protein QueC [Abyssicoccus albus]
MLNDNRALVVFSGGQDSTTCLFWALEQYDHVEVITFDYGQRHLKEIEVAKEIANELNVKQHLLNTEILTSYNANSLTNNDIEIDSSNDVPNTFVPGRNMLFLNIASIVAYQIGAKHIVTGVCDTDFSGYPDCRRDFVQSMNETMNLAMDLEFVIDTPLMTLNKKETWQLADELGQLDYIRYRTLTCYNGIVGDGCGVCPSCKLRADGLEAYLNEVGRK